MLALWFRFNLPQFSAGCGDQEKIRAYYAGYSLLTPLSIWLDMTWIWNDPGCHFFVKFFHDIAFSPSPSTCHFSFATTIYLTSASVITISQLSSYRAVTQISPEGCKAIQKLIQMIRADQSHCRAAKSWSSSLRLSPRLPFLEPAVYPELLHHEPNETLWLQQNGPRSYITLSDFRPGSLTSGFKDPHIPGETWGRWPGCSLVGRLRVTDLGVVWCSLQMGGGLCWAREREATEVNNALSLCPTPRRVDAWKRSLGMFAVGKSSMLLFSYLVLRCLIFAI